MPGGSRKLERASKKHGGSGLGGMVISGGEGGEPEVYESFALNYDAQEFRKCHVDFIAQLKLKLFPNVGEIDRCLKKVSEGVEAVEDVWQKFQSALGTSQKEKFEADLKKEIKKLQRLREQIKNWISSDMKDISMLEHTKDLIESQMERFKEVEREMKIKTYSKIGLENSIQKVDPVTQEAEEVNAWIVNCLEALEIQIDTCESEIELVLVNKKKRGNFEEQDRLEQLKSKIERHRFHIGRLETLVRLLDELASDVNYCVIRLRRFLAQVKNIQEDVDYYLEANQNPDFEENEMLYEDIDGINELPLVGVATLLPHTTDDPEPAEVSTSTNSTSLDISTSESTKSQGYCPSSELSLGEDSSQLESDRSRVSSSADCGYGRTVESRGDVIDTSKFELGGRESSASANEKSMDSGSAGAPGVIPFSRPFIPSLKNATTFKDVVRRSCASDLKFNTVPVPPNVNMTFPSDSEQPEAPHRTLYQLNNLQPLTNAWSKIASATSVSTPSNLHQSEQIYTMSQPTLNHKSMSALGKPLKAKCKEPQPTRAARSGRSTLATAIHRTKSKERSSSVPGSSCRKLVREKVKGQSSNLTSHNVSFCSSAILPEYCSPLDLHSTIQENVKAEETSLHTSNFKYFAPPPPPPPPPSLLSMRLKPLKVSSDDCDSDSSQSHVQNQELIKAPPPDLFSTRSKFPYSTASMGGDGICHRNSLTLDHDVLQKETELTLAQLKLTLDQVERTKRISSSSSGKRLCRAEDIWNNNHRDPRHDKGGLSQAATQVEDEDTSRRGEELFNINFMNNPAYSPSSSIPQIPVKESMPRSSGCESEIRRVKESFIPPILLAAPMGQLPLNPEQVYHLQRLESSHNQLLSSCVERLGQLLPRRPHVAPSYYPQSPLLGSDSFEFYRLLDVETLCFIFYYVQGSKPQYFAAKALKEKNWRFHTKLNLWFQRHDQPTITTDLYEQGTYIYFDYDEWCQRKWEGFIFEYQYLEDYNL